MVSRLRHAIGSGLSGLASVTRIDDLASGVVDTWNALDNRAPAVTDAMRSLARLYELSATHGAVNPYADSTNPLTNLLGTVTGAPEDVANVGHRLVEGPALAGLNRGLEPVGLSWATPAGADNPFAITRRDEQGNLLSLSPRDAAEAATGRLNNPVAGLAARGALAGLDVATNPATYVPVGGQLEALGLGLKGAPVASQAARLGVEGGLGLLGVGGVGQGGSVAQGLAGAGLGALGAVGSEIGAGLAERAGVSPVAGGLVGGLAIGGAGQGAAGLLRGRRPGGMALSVAGEESPIDQLRALAGEKITVPIEHVVVRPDLFQARDVTGAAPISEPRVQALLRRIEAEGYDPEKGRIKVVPNPDNPDELIVVSGHHRLEAARRLGLPDVPVERTNVDISNPQAMQGQRIRAVTENFETTANTVIDRANAVAALERAGLEHADIAARLAMRRGQVEQLSDLNQLGRPVLERIAAEPGLESIATEIGRGVRLYSIAPADAAALFWRAVNPDAGGRVPSPTAMRQTIDRFGKALAEAPIQNDFFGAVSSESGGRGGILGLIDQHARTVAELDTQRRVVARQRTLVDQLGASGDVRQRNAADVLLKPLNERLDALNAQRATLESDITGALKGQRTPVATIPIEPPPPAMPGAIDAAAVREPAPLLPAEPPAGTPPPTPPITHDGGLPLPPDLPPAQKPGIIRDALGSIAKAYNEVVAPARNFNEGGGYATVAGEGHPTFYLREREAMLRESEFAALQARAQVQTIQPAVLAGVSVKPGAQIDALVNDATGAAKTKLEQLRGSIPDVIQHPEDYTLTPEAQAGLATIRDHYDNELAQEAAAGRAPRSTVENYVNQAWQRDDARGAVRGSLGARQSFEQARTIPDYRTGILAGHTPTTLDMGDLVQARLMAGQRAVADQTFIRAIKDMPGIVLSSSAEGFDPQQYSRLPYGWLEQHFPSVDRIEFTRILTDLEQGALLAAKKGQALTPDAIAEAKRQLLANITTGRQSFYVRNDWKAAIENAFGGGKFATNPAVKVLDTGARAVNELALGMDWFFGGHSALMGLYHSVSLFDPLHPVSSTGDVAKAMGATLSSLFTAITGHGYQDFLTDPVTQKAARAGLGIRAPGALDGIGNPLLEGASSTGPVARLLKNVPILGPVSNYLERSQFERMVPVLKVRMWEQTVNAARRIRPDMDPAQLEREVADRIDHLFGGTSPTKLGLSRDRQVAERFSLLAGNYWRGQMAGVADVARSDMAGVLARKFWVNAGLSAFGLSVASSLISLQVTGQLTPERVQNLLAPPGSKEWDNPDNLLNPNSRGFMQLTLPDGSRVNPMGSMRTMVRALLAPVPEANKALENLKQDATAMGVVNALTNMGVESADKWWTYLRQRNSIPISVAYDLVRNKDFRGRPVVSDDSSLDPRLQALKYAGTHLIPSVGQNLVGQRALDDAQGFQPEQAAGNFLGVSVTNAPDHPRQVQDTIASFLRTQGVAPTFDPYKRLRAGDGIDSDRLDRFYKDHPEVYDYIKGQSRKPDQLPASPQGKDAAALYRAARDTFGAQRDDMLRQLDAQGVKGPEYRSQRDDIMTKYRERLNGVGMTYFRTDNPDAIYDTLKGVYGGSDKALGPVAAALDRLNAIQPRDGSQAAQQDYFDERQRFLDGLSPDIRQRIRQGELDRAARISPTEYQYVQDRELMQQYMSLPTYRFTSPQESRAINAAIGRARDLKTYDFRYANVPVASLLMLDPALPAELIPLALGAAQGKLTNPDRKRFLQDNPVLARFYANLTNDQLESLLGAA